MNVKWAVIDDYDGSTVAEHSGTFDDLADFHAFAELHYGDGDYSWRVLSVSDDCAVGHTAFAV